MKNIFFLLGVLFICACTERKEANQNHSDLTAIDLRLLDDNCLTDEDILNAINVIPLETTDDCLIQPDIQQMEVFDGKFYILDRQEKLFVFDRNGKFLHYIGRKGPGPEEYIAVSHFYIHPKKKSITLISNGSFNFVRYTLDGTYLGRGRIQVNRDSLSICRVSLLDDDHLLLQNSNSPTNRSNYVIVNESDLSFHSYQMPYWDFGTEHISDIRRNNYNGSRFYTIRFLSDTIYRWNRNGFVPELLLETGLKHATPEQVQSYGPYEFYSDATVKLNRDGYSCGIDFLFVTDKYLHFHYFGLGWFDAVFWDLQTGKGALYRGATRGKNILLYFYHHAMCTSENALVRYMYADTFFDHEQEIKALNLPQMQKLYETLKEDDNPVLILYNYKKLTGGE